MSNDNINFNDALNSVSYTFSTRSDAVEHYRDTYGTDWRKHIVDDLQKLYPDAKRASLAREFQYDKRLGTERYNSSKVSKSTAERYQKLGDSTGRVVSKHKREGITITVKGIERGNKGRPDRKRTITVKLTGDKVQSWVNDPNMTDIWDAYGFDFDSEEDGDYYIEVTNVSAS